MRWLQALSLQLDVEKMWAAVASNRFIGVFLLALAAVSVGAAPLNAQEAPGGERRLPLEFSTTSLSDQAARAFPPRPMLRNGVTLASLQRTDIDERLPDRDETLTQPETQQLLISPPPLRDGATASFVLTAVEIIGASIFPPEAFAPLYDDLLARPVSLTDITVLTDQITAMYRREGYFLSRAIAPAQDTLDGVLRINIVEGYVSEIAIEGDASATVKRRLDAIVGQRPLQLMSLERILALIGDLPGVSVVSSRLEPDIDDFALHRLVIKIEVDQVEANLYTDNRGTDAAGPVQIYARAAVNSVALSGDQLSVGVFTIPDDPDELILGDISYQASLTDAGTYVTLSGMVSKFDAGASLLALGTQSKTKRISIRFSHPIVRRRKLSLWGNVGFEGRDIEEEQLGAPLFEDKLRIIHASANFRQNHWNGSTTAYARASHGLNMFDSATGSASLSRPDADGGFTKLEGQITRYQSIGETFGVYASLTGQFSDQPLVASEEFAIGGARYGRAFDYAELTGDDGVAVLTELRYGREPNFDLLDFYQFYGFYDFGAVWNENMAPGFGEATLASAGAGLRLTFPKSVYVTFEAARPLTRTPFTQNDRDWRGFFSVSKSF